MDYRKTWALVRALIALAILYLVAIALLLSSVSEARGEAVLPPLDRSVVVVDILALMDGGEELRFLPDNCIVFGSAGYRPYNPPDQPFLLYIDMLDCRETLFSNGFEAL